MSLLGGCLVDAETVFKQIPGGMKTAQRLAKVRPIPTRLDRISSPARQFPIAERTPYRRSALLAHRPRGDAATSASLSDRLGDAQMVFMGATKWTPEEHKHFQEAMVKLGAKANKPNAAVSTTNAMSSLLAVAGFKRLRNLRAQKPEVEPEGPAAEPEAAPAKPSGGMGFAALLKRVRAWHMRRAGLLAFKSGGSTATPPQASCMLS